MIREARDGDLEGVLALLSEDAIREVDEPSEVSDGQRDAFADVTADPRQLLLVDERDGRLVATCQVTFLRVLIYDGGWVCQLESVRTISDLRGQGIGRALVEHVVGLAREHGCARVQLTTNAQRTRARTFYERLGFVPSHVGMKLSLIRPA